MIRMPMLEPEALRALIIANISGPNCLRKDTDRLLSLYHCDRKISIKELFQFFPDGGPITSLMNYAVHHQKNILTKDDIVFVYCVDHIDVVRASEMSFYNGSSQDYFRELGQNRFLLDRRNLRRFLFSCIGKIGIVEKRKGDFYQVRLFLPTGKIIGKNLVSPLKLKKGTVVAIHYAGIFAEICDEIFQTILDKQSEKPWFGIFRQIRIIDYKNWLRNDLSNFTVEGFVKLPQS